MLSLFITSLRHYIIADRFLAHLLRELLALPASQLFQVHVLAAALRASGVPVGPALPLGDLPQHDVCVVLHKTTFIEKLIHF